MRQDNLQRFRGYCEQLADRLSFDVAGRPARAWLRLAITVVMALFVAGGLAQLALNDEPIEVSYPLGSPDNITPASAGHSFGRR